MRKFKLLIVILIPLISFLNKSFAQETQFGIMGGLNISNLSNIPIGLQITSTSNTGFHIGAFANIPLGLRFDFQPQLLYSQLGGTFTQSWTDTGIVSGSTANVTSVTVITYSYFLIPLNFVYKFSKGWSIHAGPYISFLLTDKEENTETAEIPGYQTLSQDTLTNSTQGDNKFDLGYNIGIGYTLQNGLGFNFSYSSGIVNVIQSVTYTNPTYIQPAFGLNNWFSFSISYLFR
jgi:outer membrane protein with beta-barrel domain